MMDYGREPAGGESGYGTHADNDCGVGPEK